MNCGWSTSNHWWMSEQENSGWLYSGVLLGLRRLKKSCDKLQHTKTLRPLYLTSQKKNPPNIVWCQVYEVVNKEKRVVSREKESYVSGSFSSQRSKAKEISDWQLFSSMNVLMPVTVSWKWLIRNLIAYFNCNRKIKPSKETFFPDLISGHTVLCYMDSSLLLYAECQFMFISFIFSV